MQANFDGAERAFHIEDMPCFEACCGSAYRLLQRFVSGDWTASDVANVLSFALHGPNKQTLQFWSLSRDAARFGLPTGRVPYTPDADVLRIVSAAPGDYASLASEILTEALFSERAA